MKKIKTKKKLDASKYVNIETGESLLHEEGNVTSINVESSLVKIDYKEYVMVDSKAWEYIKKEFNHSEQGKIFQMCDMVKTCYNLLYSKKNKDYHTKETLRDEIDYTRNIYASFMKKLFNKSVIYYIQGMKDGKECTWIMLNPTLARKNQTTHQKCLAVFDDLRKKLKNPTPPPVTLRYSMPHRDY